MYLYTYIWFVDSFSQAGDTFVVRVSSRPDGGGEVLLQPSPLRELGRGRYSAGLLAADAGSYT